MLLYSTLESADHALVQAARLGDRAAFGCLYQRYRRMVHGILLAHVPYSDAEDLMQDVFVQAIQQVAGLRDEGAFGAWLARIARNRAIDHQRRARPSADATELERIPARTDSGAAILGMIRKLPEAYRETLMLRLVEGMTGPEIAAHTGLKPDSVRVNLCRGMKLLRAQLERKGGHA